MVDLLFYLVLKTTKICSEIISLVKNLFDYFVKAVFNGKKIVSILRFANKE